MFLNLGFCLIKVSTFNSFYLQRMVISHSLRFSELKLLLIRKNSVLILSACLAKRFLFQILYSISLFFKLSLKKDLLGSPC